MDQQLRHRHQHLLLLITYTTSLLISHFSAAMPTVPAIPVQSTQTETCRLDLSDELFGGVGSACARNNRLDRNRCCPVLAAWLFAAHARTALQISAAPSPAELPIAPDDSQRCVDSLQSSLLDRNIKIPQPNASCDAVSCFCGIRLHQIASLSCPAAFSVSPPYRNATPTPAVKDLEKSCRNASYSGCNKCLTALHKLTAENGTSDVSSTLDERGRKMFNRDCQLMGLTWLLTRNKTAYIPTVSAVLRAVLYSPHPHDSSCTADQENMPLAVDSVQFDSGSHFVHSLPGLPLTLALYYALFSFMV